MHAKRAPPARQRGFLQLCRCIPTPPRMNRALPARVAVPTARAPTCARAPRSIAPCWQGARRGDQEVLEAYVNKMLNVLDDACRLQEAGGDVWT